MVNMLFFVFLISHIIFLVIVIYNFISAPKIHNISKNPGNDKKISILIPVRNEEKNIGKLLNSLKAQTLKNYEIIVLDDGSTDNSYNIIDAYKNSIPNIRLIEGEELPKGWLGKNWACYQLSKLASNPILLFIDADVILKSNALAYSAWMMEKHKLSMLSIFPTQITNTWGERLVVPLMNWLLLTFLPLYQVYKSGNKSLSAANGQFILIEKDAYTKIGSHRKFKMKVVEDMEIIRSIKENKMKAMTCLGNKTVYASMYGSLADSISGFSKNFFAGFNTSRSKFLILISALIFFFLLPIIFSVWNSQYLIIAGFIIFERVFVSKLSGENIFFNIILHPFQILIMFIIGLRSFSKKKKIWKDRAI